MSDDYQESVQEPVRQLAAGGGDLREAVRRLVVAALVERQVEPRAIREVMQATVDGLGEGLSGHAESARHSLKSAVSGLDEALSKSLHALNLALDESWQNGKRFTEEDLRTAYEAVKGLEDDMVGTLKSTGERSKGVLRDEFAHLREHLSRAGSDTGRQARDVLVTLTRQMSDTAGGMARDTHATVHDARQRLSAVTSGILRGLADSLDQRKT